LTLAIETSCDDTCVAVLDKSDSGPTARLLFNKKVTSDHREFGGVLPTVASASHVGHLAPLVKEALRSLPEITSQQQNQGRPDRVLDVAGVARRKPDFVSVTRGPGMVSSLSMGLMAAKGLAVAWDVPLMAVNHMQAHALTPRLVGALEEDQNNSSSDGDSRYSPTFPFLTLLVSGGHTQLVLSRSVTSHSILANADDIAIGDLLDKSAREILPDHVKAQASNVMYGAMLERFAYPDAPLSSPSSSLQPLPPYNYEFYQPPLKREHEVQPFEFATNKKNWIIEAPLRKSRRMEYNLTSLGSQVRGIARELAPDDVEQRRLLARALMKLAFEHLASRIIFALDSLNSDANVAPPEWMHKKQRIMSKTKEGVLSRLTPTITPTGNNNSNNNSSNNSNKDPQELDREHKKARTLVVSGGVASNRFLRHVLRRVLDVRGYGDVNIVAPPPVLCTDNAAMIAWTAAEMWEAGYRSDLDVLALRKWSIDPHSESAEEHKGILGVDGWLNVKDGGKAV